MHLYGIRLVPVKEVSGADPIATMPAELVSLKEKLRSAINSRSLPLIQSYGIALRELREKVSESDDLDGALEVQKEYNRAEKLAADPALILEPTADP